MMMNYLHIHPKRGSRTLFNQGRGRIANIKKKKIHFDTSTPLPHPQREIHACFILNRDRKSNFGEGDVHCIMIVRRILYAFPQAKRNRGWG
jgi:hypothetical protein